MTREKIISIREKSIWIQEKKEKKEKRISFPRPSLDSSKIIYQCLRCEKRYKIISSCGAPAGISHGWCEECYKVIRFQQKKEIAKRKLKTLLKAHSVVIKAEK